MQQSQIPFAHLINTIFGTKIHHFGWTVPTILAIIAAGATMVFVAWIIEKYILQHLIGQPDIILFMATIGMWYFMHGFAPLMWGSEVMTLDVGLSQGLNEPVLNATEAMFGYGFFLDNLGLLLDTIEVFSDIEVLIQF